MLVTYEYATAVNLGDMVAWGDALTVSQRNRFYDRQPVGVVSPPVELLLRVPAFKVPPLVDLFGPMMQDRSTASNALYPRLYPDGFACVKPEGVVKGSPAYQRWEEYCNRAEREYVTFAKTLGLEEAAEYLLPACVAHEVSVAPDAETLYRAILRVLNRFADDRFKPLRPLFRSLLEVCASGCDLLFGTLYDRFIVFKDPVEEAKELAEMANEGEGIDSEV